MRSALRIAVTTSCGVSSGDGTSEARAGRATREEALRRAALRSAGGEAVTRLERGACLDSCVFVPVQENEAGSHLLRKRRRCCCLLHRSGTYQRNEARGGGSLRVRAGQASDQVALAVDTKKGNTPQAEAPMAAQVPSRSIIHRP